MNPLLLTLVDWMIRLKIRWYRSGEMGMSFKSLKLYMLWNPITGLLQDWKAKALFVAGIFEGVV